MMKPQPVKKLLGVSLVIILLVSGYSITQARGETPEPEITTPAVLPITAPAFPGGTREWDWYNGTILWTTVWNCISIIDPYITPYTEYGFGTYVGYTRDAIEHHPEVNEPYYVAIVVYGVGNPCSNMYAYLTFHLPPSTSLAFSESAPMYCWANTGGDWIPYECDYDLQQLAPGHYAILSGEEDIANTFPVPSGGGWEIHVPFITSTTLSNAEFKGEIDNIEADNNPDYLYPTVPITVWPATTPLPGAFNKINPANGAVGVSLSPNLSWTASSDATFYEYCFDTSNDNACSSWVNVGLATNETITGLTPDTTYYWQVRAKNTSGTTDANGSATAFWSFKTASPTSRPGAFSKTSPSDGAVGIGGPLFLSWEASSGATSYEFCMDIKNDYTCSPWLNVGTATMKYFGKIATDTTYYWQVRAKNNIGETYANGSMKAFWSFSTGFQVETQQIYLPLILR